MWPTRAAPIKTTIRIFRRSQLTKEIGSSRPPFLKWRRLRLVDLAEIAFRQGVDGWHVPGTSALYDTNEGARVPAEDEHLLEDRVDHQLAQGDISSLRESHDRAAGVGRDSDDFRVSDIGHQGRPQCDGRRRRLLSLRD